MLREIIGRHVFNVVGSELAELAAFRPDVVFDRIASDTASDGGSGWVHHCLSLGL